MHRYDSTSLSNRVMPLPGYPPQTLLNIQAPWYSYAYTDMIDIGYTEPYGTAGNTFLGDFTTSRTLGRRYYEMTDHLGNVLATVLDRKTGSGTDPGSSGTLYDHWSADLASTADYYPGGMMMPGRNTEYSWSRMGYNGKQKDDEVYGKGNLVDYGERGLDTRLIIWRTPDKLFAKYPSSSPYAFAGNSPIMYREIDGRDYGMYINHDTKTIVIKATYYTAKNDAISSTSAQRETQFWNNESGKHQYIVSNGNTKIAYDIVFELTTVDADNPQQQIRYDRFTPEESAIFNQTPQVTDKSSNSYAVRPDNHKAFNGEGGGTNVAGITFGGNDVNVKESHTGETDATGRHEIGHSLGIRHRKEGLMTEGHQSPNQSNNISSGDVQLIIHNALKKDPESGGKGTVYSTGKSPVSPNSFRKGEISEKPKK